jgi:hypothetical protein
VVFALAILLNFGIRGLDEQVKISSSHMQYTTNIVGTCVSGFFLFLIAAFNVVILAGIITVFRKMRQGAYDDAALEEQLNNRGCCPASTAIRSEKESIVRGIGRTPGAAAFKAASLTRERPHHEPQPAARRHGRDLRPTAEPGSGHSAMAGPGNSPAGCE